MYADGLPSSAVTWCAGQVAGLILCSACFAGAAVRQTPPCCDLPLDTTCGLSSSFLSMSHTVTDGNEAESHLVVQTDDTAADRFTENLQAKSVGSLRLPALRAWETPAPAPLGYMLEAHSDI